MLNNQKGVIQVFILLLLLVGLAVGIYLVQTKTNLFPRAASGPISEPIPTTPIPTVKPRSPSGPIPPSPKLPDLVISGIEVLGIPRVGRTNSINVRVENKGTASAKFPQSNQGNVSILITGEGVTLGSCSGRLKSEIKPGEKTSLQIRNCPKYTRTGTHKLTGTVDSSFMVKESNEDNNYNVIQVTVGR